MLAILDEKGTPWKPGRGYPWLTITTAAGKAVLLCPEDGIGDAVLVFEDGSILRRDANLNDHKLSYFETIRPLEGSGWFEIDIGKGWEELVLGATESSRKRWPATSHSLSCLPHTISTPGNRRLKHPTGDLRNPP